MALFSNKKAIREAKEAAGAMQQGAVYGMEAADAANARILAGEAAKTNIFSALGQEGTYEPGSGAGDIGGGGTNLFDSGAMPNQAFKKMAPNMNRGAFKTPREGVIDPEGYANAAIGTTSFKIRSKMTAEAYQLLNKEGPEWDMLEQSTLGTIHEGAALQLRDTLRQLKNNYAKGGTARRAAMNEFGEIQAAESAMRMRTQEAWRANLDLHEYIRANADRVQAGNIAYVNSLPGLNSAYRDAMTKTATLMVTAGKTAALIAKSSYDVRADQQAVNFGTKLLEAGIMAATSQLIGGGFGAAGDWITEQGGTGEGASGYGKFTDYLGGGVKAIGGDISGLLDQKGEGTFDANAAALNRETGGV